MSVAATDQHQHKGLVKRPVLPIVVDSSAEARRNGGLLLGGRLSLSAAMQPHSVSILPVDQVAIGVASTPRSVSQLKCGPGVGA